jgi:hypothetical protein
MYFKKRLREAMKSHNPRSGITLVGGSTLILYLAGFAQAERLTDLGTALLDAGNGSVVVSGNGTTVGCIDWYNGGSPPACPSASTGMLTVEGGSTSPFTVGSTGTIQNLAFNTTYPVVDFIAIGGLDFDLIDVRFNTGPAIGICTSPGDTNPGVSCTPADSPFTLTNGLTDPITGMVDTVTIEFTVDAEGYTGSSGTNYNQADPYVGIFTTQQAVQGMNIQGILAMIESGGSVNASWSASFTPSAQTLITGDVPFQIKYAANLNIGESYIDIINTGANGCAVLGPGFGAASGNICVNVYAFDPGEELISCCSCLVTCDQTVNLGVNRDLLSNPAITSIGGVPVSYTSVTVKLLATLAGTGGSGTTCSQSAANVGATTTGVTGLAAWGTTLHGNPTGGYDTTETPFTPATLSPGEAASLGGRCAAILGNGSGAGICNSCRAGALGAGKI